MKKKIALFDFCETIVDMQSADAFIDFARIQLGEPKFMKRLEQIRVFLVKIYFFKVINRVFSNNALHKRLKLLQLKGIKRSILEKMSEQYYTKKLKPRFFNKIIQIMKNHINQGNRVIIVSGGYKIYIKRFGKEFGIPDYDILTTEIIFDLKSDKCTGKFEFDCMRQNKVTLLKSTLGDFDSIDLKNSFAYSDSPSDLPMLSAVGNSFVISKKTIDWPYTHGLKLILVE